MKQANRVEGSVNEEVARKFLVKKKKLKIIEQNYRNKIGEIDIIAMDGHKTVIFVEVKYRRTAMFGLGREAVDGRKIIRLDLML